LTRSATSFPEKTTAKDGKKFMGYFATHYLVKLKTAPPDSTDARYADTKVEIQVASVLMHAWAEVEHDLEYKPESGTISEDESTILDEVNGLVLSGELALELLQRAMQRRTASQEVEFRDQFDLASYLTQRTNKGNWNNTNVGRVDVLLVAAGAGYWRLTFAVADLVGSAVLMADTCTVAVGTVPGAVYKPEELIIPVVDVPPAVPFTSQVTRLSEVPVTLAVNCAACPASTVEELGETATAMDPDGGVGVPVDDDDGPLEQAMRLSDNSDPRTDRWR
jgi:hypothetical protein